ncbi:nitrile hydratase subunit alpha [Acuticoccus sp. MNP-M23]|uniref:nitrile hydratase subunit alpha n=1 Tax=Acuticoccus sp. MNP-M23 TaxID=3072793 RepID=UPI0028154F69|nr:nitrile hydratase subunit alpha [Acuticoccus sp. MNP-M23]WMS43843.1 nitrile hydratase subunit alpha [Acuticoccus sp. MNP-M23]
MTALHGDHGHDHDHDAHEALVVEDDAGNLEGQIMVDALQDVLIARGLITAPEVTKAIEKLESPGIHQGAAIVARAWTDADYKARLLGNGKSAIGELGIAVGEAQIVVVENTAKVHNLITCTLCSCYPRSILGQPPSWYISKAYRARSVREPRKVLAEFGTALGDDVDVIVHDSNADMRYLVLPEPPIDADTASPGELEALVTRDRLIGVIR